MELEKLYCDRCGREVKYLTPVKSRSIGLDRELCSDCIDSLKAWLRERPSPKVEHVTQINERELRRVYERGAEALEAWANGATADEMAEHVRDMLVYAKQEAQAEPEPQTILGIAI